MSNAVTTNDTQTNSLQNTGISKSNSSNPLANNAETEAFIKLLNEAQNDHADKNTKADEPLPGPVTTPASSTANSSKTNSSITSTASNIPMALPEKGETTAGLAASATLVKTEKSQSTSQAVTHYDQTHNAGVNASSYGAYKPPAETNAPPADTEETGSDARQTAGQGLTTLYDGVKRDGYHKAAKSNAANAVAHIDKLKEEGGKLDEIKKVSEEAFQKRQDLRVDTQNKLTPGGKIVSQAVETPRTFDGQYEIYNKRLEAKAKTNGANKASQEDIYRELANASGRSNKVMDYIAKGGKVIGIAGTAYGMYTATDAIMNAKEGEKGRVAAEQGGGVLGGAAGGVTGALVGAGAVALLASNPIGWVVMGGSAVLGGIGGYFGSEAGKDLGTMAYDWATGN